MMFYSSLSWFIKAGRAGRLSGTDAARRNGSAASAISTATSSSREGAGEIMVEHGVHAWDIAALKPIVEEAGGRLTDWDGGWDINRPDVIASNGKLHDDDSRPFCARKK